MTIKLINSNINKGYLWKKSDKINWTFYEVFQIIYAHRYYNLQIMRIAFYSKPPDISQIKYKIKKNCLKMLEVYRWKRRATIFIPLIFFSKPFGCRPNKHVRGWNERASTVDSSPWQPDLFCIHANYGCPTIGLTTPLLFLWTKGPSAQAKMVKSPSLGISLPNVEKFLHPLRMSLPIF